MILSSVKPRTESGSHVEAGSLLQGGLA